jgi:signal transduction histidine kinase
MQNIRSMFESATLQLTAWYLLGVMLLSVSFSVLIYNLSIAEFSARLGVIETRLEEREVVLSPRFDFEAVQRRQLVEVRQNIVTTLVYTNLVILAIASVASYLWARRTLRPIEEAHEAQSRFTSDASHELRTPLSVMQAEIEMALRNPKATKREYREILESNHEEVARLTGLSNVLLKIAHLDLRSISWQEANLQTILETAIQSFSAQDQARIQLHKSKKVIKIHANPESFTELIIILLDNALKYSTPDTPVQLSARRQKGRIYCSVTNEGPGISSDEIGSIFHRFYRSNSTRTYSQSPSFGLGLSLAKKIAELHHGEISVKSTPHKQTTFTVKIS